MMTPKQRGDNAARQAAFRARAKVARADERAAKGLPPAPTLPTMPSSARWKALIETARAALDTAADEMQAYHDERSEKWQESERAALLLEQIGDLQEITAQLEGIEL